MDKNEKKSVTNPRKGANLISILTCRWLLGTFLMGYKRDLDISDLYSPLDEYSSRLLGNKISRLWAQELERCKKSTMKRTPSLLRVLVKGFGRETMAFGLIHSILEFVVKTTQPLFLAKLLKCIHENNTGDSNEIYYWGTGITVGVFFDGLISNFTTQGLKYMGMKIRVACCSLMYRKVLKITKVEAEGKTSIGQMINLLSNDVSKLDYSVFTIHYIWITPIQTAVISYLLYREVGLAVLPGIAILVLFVPIYGCYGKIISYLMKKISSRTDERLRLTNQILSGIKVIKMYAWEKPFAYLNDKAREKEVQSIRNSLIANEISQSCNDNVPRICIFTTVIAYILLGNNVDAGKVYLVTAYYYVLRISFYRGFTLNTKFCAEALVSVKRLTKFLLFDEIKLKSLANSNVVKLKTHNEISLSLRDVTAQWNSESKFESLKGISFQLQSGSLTAVIGQVGAGKTTLIQAILGEVPDTRGEIKVNGKISYSSQEPWLFASSIKQNILFGKPMDRDRYNKVIEVCQLKRDFQLLPYGENTLVGDKGINLSGGQRARVNLARAVYHEADIYLLDDPLSSVDNQVGKGIFQDCVKSFLKDKTVVLIIHQLHYLKYVDRIIILSNGTVLADGTYTNIVNSGVNLTKMVQHEKKCDEIPDSWQDLAEQDEVQAGKMSNVEEVEPTESRTSGSVSWKIYLQYFKAARSDFLILLVFVIITIGQIFRNGADYFITYWVNVEEEGRNVSSFSDTGLLRGRDWYVYVYGAITISCIFVTFVQAYSFSHMCMKSSKNLHATIFRNVIQAKMAFFNANPIGHIMNRFSKDVEIIDTKIPEIISDILQNCLYTIAVVGIVASISPWSLIPALVITVVAYFLTLFYMKTSRSIKRLERITRSPVFNHLSASVHGLTTIRALNAQQILTNEFDNYQDLHSSAWFIFFSGSRAFEMYLDFLCATYLGLVIYTLLSLADFALVGDAGLVITKCILMSTVVRWGVRQATELENQMTSVERILEYTKLEQEPLLPNMKSNKIPKELQPEEESLMERSEGNKTPDKWPQRGQISFKDVSLTYDRQEKPALRNLNFVLEPKEVIGIVGRTGAGKSSIINALFRLADIQGEIYIDNVDTNKIALHDLRSRISIIPQEPVLFAGSLRTNLDPFVEYSDHRLWQALEDVDMKEYLQSSSGLNTRVAEGGANFSVGQRQLLCLARAIVRNNKVLVLDEATANVDPQTDELIQKAIRQKFANCTVLIIAHRLHSVMDSNKILVMEAGEIVEFDHPYNLLQRRNGIFYNMVQESGPSTAENLFQVAKLNYEKFHDQ